MGLKIVPLTLKEANQYIIQNHRHHDKATGHKFSIGVIDEDGILHGVAVVGHPQGRFDDNGKRVEVLRLCTDGTHNACSILYGRCARISKEMGYEEIITFILESESGTSLKASGWKCVNKRCGGFSWENNQRHKDRQVGKQLSFIPKKEPPKEFKQRWIRKL